MATTDGVIQDLKSKLAGQEQNLESHKEREKSLLEKLAAVETLWKEGKGALDKLQKMTSLWTKEVVDTAERISSQLAVMDMKSWSFIVNDQDADRVRLTKFSHGLNKALKTYHDDRSASFFNKSRQFARNILYTVLLNLACPPCDGIVVLPRLRLIAMISRNELLVLPRVDRLRFPLARK